MSLTKRTTAQDEARFTQHVLNTILRLMVLDLEIIESSEYRTGCQHSYHAIP